MEGASEARACRAGHDLAFAEAAREYFSMWVRRDFSRFDALFARNCRYEECYGPVYEGLDELHRWIDAQLEAQIVEYWDIHEVMPVDARDVLVVTWTFCAKEDRRYCFDGASIIAFDEDGKIAHVREFKAEHERFFPQKDVR